MENENISVNNYDNCNINQILISLKNELLFFEKAKYSPSLAVRNKLGIEINDLIEAPILMKKQITKVWNDQIKLNSKYDERKHKLLLNQIGILEKN